MSVYLVFYKIRCVIKYCGDKDSDAFFSKIVGWDWVAGNITIAGRIRVRCR